MLCKRNMAGENALTAQAPVQCIASNDIEVYCAAIHAHAGFCAQESAPRGFFALAAQRPDSRRKAGPRGLQVEVNLPGLVRIRA